MTKLFGVYKPMSNFSFTPKNNRNTIISTFYTYFNSLSYFYIVSRQEETRFKKAKKYQR